MEVSSGKMLTPPADPTKAASGTTTYYFRGWYTTPKDTGHTGKTKYKLATPLTANITLYDRWYTEQATTKGALQVLIAAATPDANLNHIDVRKVTDMSQLFERNTTFNGDISGWDVSGVGNMASMFAFASVFNQPLNNWDVAKVEDMGFMFNNVTAFNQNIDSWNVAPNVNKANMFVGSPLANNLPSWAC